MKCSKASEWNVAKQQRGTYKLALNFVNTLTTNVFFAYDSSVFDKISTKNKHLGYSS